MVIKAKSRWAAAEEEEEEEEENDDEVAKDTAKRKQEKEDRRRAKQDRLLQAKDHQTNEAQPSNEPSEANGEAERPLKRLKQSPDPGEATTSRAEQWKLLSFPTTRFGPCRSVEEYDRLNDIDEGSYGLVSRAREIATGSVVALKKLKMDYTNDGFPVTGLREMQTLMASRHPHIVHLREVVVGSTPKDIYLVMDFVEHDLKTLLDDMAEPFLPSETKTLLLQITSATAYLHSHWILHRDLKTSNLLLNNRGEIKLADFGMARYYSPSPTVPNLTQTVTTLWYRAPELLLATPNYSSTIDIWSLGCIFAELLTKAPLFQGRNEVDQLSRIFQLIGTPTQTSWPEFRSLPHAKALHPLLSSSRASNAKLSFSYLSTAGLKLLSAMLSLNPASRPTAEEVLTHPYFMEDPRPKAKEFFPTFPSKAGQERRRRRRETPNAPLRGEAGGKKGLGAEDFARGLFGGGEARLVGEEEEEEDGGGEGEEKGAGFALRLG